LKLGSITGEGIAEIKQQFADHGVVFFRDIGATNGNTITNDEHVHFAEQFGEVNVNRFFDAVESHPAIAKVEKKIEQNSAIGEFFHADHTYDVVPAMGSMLVARELPESGGDTVFVDMRKAYDSLPANIKAQLVGLRAVHSSRHAFGNERKDKGTGQALFKNAEAAVQDTIHPVVIAHPVSGRKTLFVNPGFTIHFEGKSPKESLALLKTLYHYAVQPSNMMRFVWAPGSAALWDNRAVWHCAMNDYPGKYRLMHRVTIEGEQLNAADLGGVVSKPCVDEPANVMAMARGETPLDLPYVQLLRSTIQEGMANAGGDFKPWWPEPSWPLVLAARVLSWGGIQAKL